MCNTLGGKKTNLRPWCLKKTKRKMVLKIDIGLEDLISLSLYSPVGILSYKHLCLTDLVEWVLSTWQPLLGSKVLTSQFHISLIHKPLMSIKPQL